MNTKVDVQSFCKAFIKYFEQAALAFIEIYKEVSAVLNRMDELKKEGVYWFGILAGGPEHLV